MVTHDVQEAFELGDRICLMDKGKIVQCGSPSELLFKPHNGFVKGFLAYQRLQLEFKTIRLSDIWNWLAPQSPKGGANLSHDASLWTGLEHFKFTATETVSISNKETQEAKSASFEQLMSAFYQYKKQHAHE